MIAYLTFKLRNRSSPPNITHCKYQIFVQNLQSVSQNSQNSFPLPTDSELSELHFLNTPIVRKAAGVYAALRTARFVQPVLHSVDSRRLTLCYSCNQ